MNSKAHLSVATERLVAATIASGVEAGLAGTRVGEQLALTGAGTMLLRLIYCVR